MSSPPDPAFHQRGGHLLRSAGQLLRDVTTMGLARRLTRVSTGSGCSLDYCSFRDERSQPARTFLTGPLTLGDVTMDLALGLTCVSREMFHSRKTQIPREVGEEAEVDEAPSGVDRGLVHGLFRLSDSQPSQVAWWIGPPNEFLSPPI